jgi:hypothetical protein
MIHSPENTMKIADFRRRINLGEELSTDEMKEIVVILRQDRASAQVASTTSRTKKAAAKAPVDTSALLQGLMGKKENQ